MHIMDAPCQMGIFLVFVSLKFHKGPLHKIRALVPLQATVRSRGLVGDEQIWRLTLSEVFFMTSETLTFYHDLDILFMLYLLCKNQTGSRTAYFGDERHTQWLCH